ncbi:hypothetical protein ACFYWX_47445 [Streptomyces sp. NPDC002888]
MAGRARGAERRAYFRSVGLGIEDAAVAWAALHNDNAMTKGQSR